MKWFMGFTNTSCEFFGKNGCHDGVKREFNCLFCYCPLIDKECPGPYTVIDGKYGKVKDCSSCTLPHDGYKQSWMFIQRWRPVSPMWDNQPQSPEKVRKLSKIVKESFDMSDIKWAIQTTEE
jgi:Zn-finger protein